MWDYGIRVQRRQRWRRNGIRIGVGAKCLQLFPTEIFKNQGVGLFQPSPQALNVLSVVARPAALLEKRLDRTQLNQAVGSLRVVWYGRREDGAPIIVRESGASAATSREDVEVYGYTEKTYTAAQHGLIWQQCHRECAQ